MRFKLLCHFPDFTHVLKAALRHAALAGVAARTLGARIAAMANDAADYSGPFKKVNAALDVLDACVQLLGQHFD